MPNLSRPKARRARRCPRTAAVLRSLGPDGKWGIWPLDGGGLRPVPELDSKYYVSGWTQDGASLYALSTQRREGAARVFRVNIATGKMEYWKTFGENLPAGVASVGGPRFSSDGSAYAYVYSQVLSQAYVVKGLK